MLWVATYLKWKPQPRAIIEKKNIENRSVPLRVELHLVKRTQGPVLETLHFWGCTSLNLSPILTKLYEDMPPWTLQPYTKFQLNCDTPVKTALTTAPALGLKNSCWGVFRSMFLIQFKLDLNQISQGHAPTCPRGLCWISAQLRQSSRNYSKYSTSSGTKKQVLMWEHLWISECMVIYLHTKWQNVRPQPATMA